jgi:predicted MFS family arabinose efflux permease
MIYVTGHYDLRRSVASPLLIFVGVGAIVGVLAGGRLADWLLHRGHVSARIIVPGIALVLMVIFMAPAIWTTNAGLGFGLMTPGAAALGAVNPPLDSARLDIMHPRLWGRAESVRITLRMLLEAAAPTVFGFISVRAFGGGTVGLKWTFLLMLIPLLIASALSIWARCTYPRDVATASASLEATRASGGGRRARGRGYRR